MDKIIISDSCSLILLEKTKTLNNFLKHNKIIIPESVYKETITNGLKYNYPDARNINQYIKSDKINIKKVKKKLNIKMNEGEKEAISLYLEINGNLLITDDKKAINFSKLKKIKYSTTPEIVYKLFKSKYISKNKYIYALDILSKQGWYNSEIINFYYKKILGDKNVKSNNFKIR